MNADKQSSNTILPPEPQPCPADRAAAAMVLGLLGLAGWLLPILGLPLSAIGVILGRSALRSPRRRLAWAGLILSALSLTASAANVAWEIRLSLRNEQPLLLPWRVIRPAASSGPTQ